MKEDAAISYPRLPLARFDKLVNLTLSRLLKRIGCPITRQQEIILRELRRADGLSQGELAARVGQDRNNLSRTLQLLERRKLITRHVRGSDRRSFDVRITAAGREVHKQAFKAIEAYWKILFDGFSQDEIEGFARTIHRLSDNLSTYIDDEKPDEVEGRAASRRSGDQPEERRAPDGSI